MKRKSIIVSIIVLSTVIIITLSFLKKMDYRSFPFFNSKSINEIVIKEELIDKIDRHYDFIIKESSKYSINPDAIIAIIISEHSMHSNAANYFEELYVKEFLLTKDEDYLQRLYKATKDGVAELKLEGESDKEFEWRLKHGLIWSIGICQISIYKAIDIQNQNSNFKQSSTKEIKSIIKELINPKKNIQYCLQELSSIRNKTLMKTGLDLNNNIPILITLYNTGKVDNTIKRIVDSNYKYIPQPNKMGVFVEMNLNSVKNRIKERSSKLEFVK